MAVIGIRYSGGEHDYDDAGNFIQITPVSYESVYLYTNKKEFVFDSGDFVKDWFRAKMKYSKEFSDKEHLSGSSSCDHFFMDGARYDSAYLHIVDGAGVLKYIDRSDPNFLYTQREIYEDGWEMFVEPGTRPTWDELKKMCMDPASLP